MLNTLRQIRLANPIALLHSENTGEKPPKANWLAALLGAVLLGGAYYLAVTIENPVQTLVWFFVAVIMVIIASYLLFVAGSVVICKLLQKKKGYYYKTNHFVSVSSMAYRMKRNGAGLASICILCTMVLVMISSTVCLYIGAEDSKGTDLQKQTLALLRAADARGDLHFIGNIEAKDAIKGGCDVIVTDGFSGNVMLKSIEGVGSFAGSALKGMFKKNLLTKLAALLVMPGLNAFKARLDPNKVGGTAFIGISRPVIKAHGGSNAEAIENAVGQAIQVAESGITEAIAAHIDKMQLPTV